MRQLASAAAALLALALPAAALEAPRKIVDYDIKVSLDPETKLVEGSEILKWTNPSDGPVAELRFHLYWNAFRNDRSTFFKESGGQLRGDKADTRKGWGYTDVTSMTWDGAELMKGARFESPDDGNPDDRTVLVVPLPRPVAPGETAALSIAWKAKVPRVYARAGYVRDFFMFGQWFPQIGVYEPKGRRRRAEAGWNCHQYHANSEFYADWGDWKVAITLPEKFVVGSAGALVDTKTAGGKKTLTFEQKAVHNFAFTADPRYVVVEDVFDPAKDIPKDEIASRVEDARPLRGRPPRGIPQGRDPPLPAARPPRLRPPAHRGAEVGARVDGPLGVPVPVRADLHRGHARGRHGRDRNGVRDAVHDALVHVDGALAVREDSTFRRRSRSTSSRTATGWASSPRTSSRRAGWTRASTRSPSS